MLSTKLFITEEYGGEVFVHASGLIDEIRKNNRVQYDVQEGNKGLNAVNARVV